jgi:hypothetical protein
MITDKIISALERVTFDGSECHAVVNTELKNPEHEIAASNIRHAILSQYRDTVPVDVVIEIVLKLADEGRI